MKISYNSHVSCSPELHFREYLLTAFPSFSGGVSRVLLLSPGPDQMFLHDPTEHQPSNVHVNLQSIRIHRIEMSPRRQNFTTGYCPVTTCYSATGYTMPRPPYLLFHESRSPHPSCIIHPLEHCASFHCDQLWLSAEPIRSLPEPPLFLSVLTYIAPRYIFKRTTLGPLVRRSIDLSDASRSRHMSVSSGLGTQRDSMLNVEDSVFCRLRR
jgi:hypothetical protein